MTELQPSQPPNIAPQNDGSGATVVEAPHEAPEPVPITEQEVGEYREQDRFLPIANVARIMKGSVPGTAKISKEAKESEKCQMEKRKTIGGEDILYAMITLGFDNYAEVLKIHLAKLRQTAVAGSSREATNEGRGE
ncbi:unnamed protein product [Somion occarium]|uniref:Transcription factor CBF/NF-Y/archaeal histone domain-containing protein n=1 Tax=Somion occarium TaxID=3059160 RepID=A0ABP1DNY4_9APHY